MGEAPSVANGERWPLACLCASKPLFWLIEWWSFRIWCGGKSICGEAPFYRRFPAKVASSSLCAANPPGLVSVVFLAVSPGCFSGCVARLFFWLCCQVVFLAVLPGCFFGCVARFVTDCVVRLFLAGFARVRILTFVSGVMAQDRASQISSKSNSSGLQGDSIFLFMHRYIRYII